LIGFHWLSINSSGVNTFFMCNCMLRYNLSHLEQWLRDNKMQDTGVQLSLEPIIQASQLLQARKTEADVDCICDMCSRLTTSQVSVVISVCQKCVYSFSQLYCVQRSCCCSRVV